MDSDAGDGGVLEYTTDGFTWLDARELITAGPYNAVIPSGFSSPIGGRQAWAGDLGGWREVHVDLSSLEGETLTLRWRFASDSFTGGVGWYVDDVVLDAPVIQCVACTDLDNDGSCPFPEGDDCDDGNGDVYPGAPQICDGLNNDCDDPAWPTLPANEVDGDSDGLTFCAGDCNGSDPAVHPAAGEPCDGRDNDCDGLVDNDPACDLSCDASEPAGAEIVITGHPSASTQPGLVWNGDGYGVVWSDARDGNLELYFSRLDRFGQVVVGEVRVTSATADSVEPSLVWTGAEYAVSWCDERGGAPEAYFVRLDASGNTLGSEVVLGSCFANVPTTALAWNGYEYAVVWSDASSEVRFARLDASGVPAAGAVQLSDGSGTSRAPSVAWTGSEYSVAWQDRDGANQWQIYFTRVDATGVESGGEAAVTDTPAPSRWPSLVRSDAGYGVAYNEGTGGSRLVWLTRLDASGSPVGGATQVSDLPTASSRRPSVAWSGAEYALVWHDLRHVEGEVYFTRVAASGNEIGSETRLTDNAADSVARGLVWTGTGFGVVWDESPAVRFLRLGCNCFDGDGDGWTSCNDNCSLVFNPSQPDVDADFEGDHCDLDDGMVYVLISAKTQVSWQQEQGFDTWNYYKGDLDVLKASNVYTQAPGSNDLADRLCGLAAPSAPDVAPPDPGRTAFFLVAGVSEGVEGDIGTDSAGTPRPNANPCP
jgi:hypothetical protein